MSNVEHPENNIFQLTRRGCVPTGGGPLRYEHGPYVIDEDHSFVECKTCKEKLNPIAVLAHYAKRENKIAWRFSELKQELEKLKFKAKSQNRVRCEHCQKLTRIRKESM